MQLTSACDTGPTCGNPGIVWRDQSDCFGSAKLWQACAFLLMAGIACTNLNPVPPGSAATFDGGAILMRVVGDMLLTAAIIRAIVGSGIFLLPALPFNRKELSGFAKICVWRISCVIRQPFP